MKNLFYVKIKFVKVLEKIHMKTPMKFLQTCTFAKKSNCGTLYLRDSQTSIMELYYFFFKHSFVDV